MEVILGKTAGFCGGVKRAVEETKKELEKKAPLYCLGDLVHNKEVMEELTKKGLTVIQDIKQANDKVIMRAHGVSKQIYEQAKQKKIQVIDLTCPKVLHIHEQAEYYAQKQYYLFYIGEKGHPESIGTESFCGKHYSLIETEKDILQAIEQFKESKLTKVFIFSQTTFHLEKFHFYCKQLKEKIELFGYPNLVLKIENTICDATRFRQEETSSLAKQVNTMIILGGKHSSNTNKLYEIAKQQCSNVIYIEKVTELTKKSFSKQGTIGVMAGASTSRESIENLLKQMREK